MNGKREAETGCHDARQGRAPHVRLAGKRFSWLAPTVLWPLAKQLIPRPVARPQGGGTRRADDEAMFAAVVFVLVSEVPWRALPKIFGVSWQNTHRRFGQWSDIGLWEQLQTAARSPRVPAFVHDWALQIRTAADRRNHRDSPGVGGPEEPTKERERVPFTRPPARPVVRRSERAVRSWDTSTT